MLHEILRFTIRHWPHLLLAVPGAVAVTCLHESAHALAVLLQGGAVTEFVVLPSRGLWGHISYKFPDGAPHSEFFISLAPYILWLLLVMIASLLSFRQQVVGHWRASLLFIWLFVVPLADIANTALPYLLGKDNDFYSAFGQPSIYAGFIVAMFGILAVTGGYYVQGRLYRKNSLSAVAYIALSAIAIIMFVALTGVIPVLGDHGH